MLEVEDERFAGDAVSSRPMSDDAILLAPLLPGLLVWLPDLASRFGMEHDGFNAAMWALGADAISENGLLGSRFGSEREFMTYGNHPPVTVLATWLSRRLLGESHLATRLPALLASVIAALLLVRLLQVVGCNRRSAVIAATASTSLPMFLAFGSMLDTWILGLPFGIALLLTLAERRTSSARVAAIALCCLCSWQGVVLVVLALPALARRFGIRSPAVFAAVGGLVAVFAFKSYVGAPGGLEIGWPLDGRSWTHISTYFAWMMPLIPAALLVRDRTIGFLATASPLAYAVAMSSHADIHPYWTYWWLVAAALGAGLLAQKIVRQQRVLAASVLVLAVLSVLMGNQQERADDIHASAVSDVVQAIPRGQAWMPVLNSGTVQPWLEYETGREVRLSDPTDVPPGYVVVMFGPGRSDQQCLTSTGLEYDVCKLDGDP
jgi:hypothetical protein